MACTGHGEGAHQVHVLVGEKLLRDLHILHLRGWLAGHLCPLAGCAVPTPLFDVCSQTWPDEAAADLPGGGLHACMEEMVHVLEDRTAVAAWYQRPDAACGEITPHLCCLYGDLLQLK